MKLIQLFEALPPSKYRHYRQAWKSSTYKDLFAKFDHDKKLFRIYLPLQVKETAKGNTAIQKEVEVAVNKQGFEITDYIAGIAISHDGQRRFKIGKLINDNTELLKKFSNDPVRAASRKNNLLVCISRHPYDIAGMSTGRGWTSCMNLTDREIGRAHV